MSDIMSTLNNLKNTLTKTSGDIIKQTKLSLELSKEEEKLRQIYIEIGKKTHEIYAYGGSLGKFFDAKYGEILACENNINNIKKRVETSKGVPVKEDVLPREMPKETPVMKTCMACGEVNDPKNRFCLSCGRLLT